MHSNSSLFECVIRHQRLEPRGYKFKHHSFMWLLDLDELKELEQSMRLFGCGKFRLYNFRDEDHLPGYSGSVKERILKYLTDTLGAGESARTARVELLTNLRFLNYVFNPVSFFYCFDVADNFIYAVAEVGNTFEEKKLYFLPNTGEQECGGRLAKDFYVSPFSPLHLQFDFRLVRPESELHLSVNEFDELKPTLVSSVKGCRNPISDLSVLRLTCKYPLVTLRVISMIHIHALILLLKGFQFFPKHKNPHLQTNVLNAHSSLNTPAAPAASVEAQKS